MQHHDLSLLFSLGLVGCSLDVGDALTAGSFSSTHAMSAGEGMGGGSEDTTGDDSDGGDEGNADPTGAVTGASSAAPTTDGADESTGWPYPSSGGDEAPSGGESESGGMYAELCATWDMHAEECGLGSGAAANCQYDLDYSSYLGDACAAAVEDYYSCLASTDCAELADADPTTLCGRDQVETLCSGS